MLVFSISLYLCNTTAGGKPLHGQQQRAAGLVVRSFSSSSRMYTPLPSSSHARLVTRSLASHSRGCKGSGAVV